MSDFRKVIMEGIEDYAAGHVKSMRILSPKAMV